MNREARLWHLASQISTCCVLQHLSYGTDTLKNSVLLVLEITDGLSVPTNCQLAPVPNAGLAQRLPPVGIQEMVTVWLPELLNVKVGPWAATSI